MSMEQYLVAGQDLVADVVLSGGGNATRARRTERYLGQVVPRDDGFDAWEGGRFARIDALEARVGVWAAQHFAHQQARQGHIRAKLRPPGDFIEGIDFWRPAANDTKRSAST
jgi:hypothetical protein